MRTLQFDTAVMVALADHTVSVFPDGTVNIMVYAETDSPGYRQIARDHGYGDDWLRYNIEHDATHHWLADMQGRPWSLALHDPIACDLEEAPQEYRDEEHLVNRLQAYVRAAEPDPYGRVEAAFGTALPAAIAGLRACLDAI